MKITEVQDGSITRTLVDGHAIAGSCERITRDGHTVYRYNKNNTTPKTFRVSNDEEALNARQHIAQAYVAGVEAQAKHEAEQRKQTKPSETLVIPLITEKRVRELVAEGHNDLLESLARLAQGFADLIGGLK
ncbi:MAG: hypothetical protein ACRDTI_20700 [Mycobacterium sp.]